MSLHRVLRPPLFYLFCLSPARKKQRILSWSSGPWHLPPVEAVLGQSAQSEPSLDFRRRNSGLRLRTTMTRRMQLAAFTVRQRQRRRRAIVPHLRRARSLARPARRGQDRPSRDHHHMKTPSHKLAAPIGLLTAALLALGATAWAADMNALKDAYKDHFYVGAAINRTVATGTGGGARTPPDPGTGHRHCAREGTVQPDCPGERPEVGCPSIRGKARRLQLRPGGRLCELRPEQPPVYRWTHSSGTPRHPTGYSRGPMRSPPPRTQPGTNALGAGRGGGGPGGGFGRGGLTGPRQPARSCCGCTTTSRLSWAAIRARSRSSNTMKSGTVPSHCRIAETELGEINRTIKAIHVIDLAAERARLGISSRYASTSQGRTAAAPAGSSTCSGSSGTAAADTGPCGHAPGRTSTGPRPGAAGADTGAPALQRSGAGTHARTGQGGARHHPARRNGLPTRP